MKKSVHIILFFICSISSVCNAQKSVANSEDIELIPLLNKWWNTSNPVSYFYVDKNTTNVDIAYTYESGKYKRITDATTAKGINVFTEGFKRIKKIQFYGLIDYNKTLQKEQKWNNVLFPSPNNPFILGDSVGGDYHNEIFLLKGGVASSFKKGKFIWGTDISYKVGNSTDQNDPRPEIESLKYSIKPGILWRNKGWELGLDIQYEHLKEDIAISVVEYNIPQTFFLFHGLGEYFKRTGSSYKRYYKGDAYEGNMQYSLDLLPSVSNIAQLGYALRTEKAADGGETDPFKAGDYKEKKVRFGDLVFINGKEIKHQIKMDFMYLNSSGTWYDQKEVTNENSQTQWQVYNQSVVYKENKITASAGYSLLKLKNKYRSYDLTMRAFFEQSKTTHYPELYFQKYANVYFSAEGNKAFHRRKGFQFLIGATAEYKKNISHSEYFTGMKLADLWTYPMSAYLTADHAAGGMTLKIEKNVKNTDYYVKMKINYVKPIDRSDYFDSYRKISSQINLGVFF